jgi:hypothetical protein
MKTQLLQLLLVSVSFAGSASRNGAKPKSPLRILVAEVGKTELLLPQQEGHLGDSARFALALRWEDPPSIFSDRFRLVAESFSLCGQERRVLEETVQPRL